VKKWTLKSLIVLLFCLSGACMQAQEPSGPVALLVEHPTHFTTPDGQDVLVVPGQYQAEAAGENRLRLLPTEKKEDAFLVEAKPLSHQETKNLPLALSFSGKAEDTHHIALLLTGGKGLQAIGNYSGVRSRATEPVLISPIQLTTQVSLATQRVISMVPQVDKVHPVSPQTDPVKLRETEDPFNLIHAAEIQGGKVARFSSVQVPREAYSQQPFPQDKPKKPALKPRREKIHPLLKAWIGKRSPNESELIVVSLKDTLNIPRFPEPAILEPRDSETNKKALARAEELIRTIQTQRAQGLKGFADELLSRHKAQVLESFWLVNSVAVKMPLGAVRALAERAEVVYLEPVHTLDMPPQNANARDDVDDGRSRIVSDPYFNLGLTGGFIGLLDSGMRFTHTQFNSPSHIAFRRDCVNGGDTCNSGSNLNPNDDCWNHGTSSAGIITANANQGNAFRGVTGITLDSFKVYPTSFGANGMCNGGLDTTATVRGFQRAVAVLDRVIVAEMQGSGNDFSAVSLAADLAFNAGAVVIAANGNNGPNASTVNTPANAHKVIGVGNFDVQTQAQVNSQSRGPAPDNRIKPDIQTPTNTETASNGCGFGQNCTTAGSDTALRVFGGTSGATPYGGAAAALLRNWLRGTSFSIDPGQVYAQLILSGQQPFPFNNTRGAGPVRLPTDGYAWWGKVSVSNGATINIPLHISGGNPNTLDGALWWPESPFGFHNDIDLSLVDPGGVVRASSPSVSSVFERAKVSGPVSQGTWKLRIRGYSVMPILPQTVYWAAHVRR
jgi:serine protease AprX